MSGVDVSALRAGINAAMSWTSDNLPHFALPDGPLGIPTLEAIKPLGELVLVCEKLVRDEETAGEPERILGWAWGQLHQGDLMLRVLAARPDLIVISTVQASFAAMGYCNDRLDRLSAHLHSSSSCAALELPLWRRLDIAHARASLEGRPLSADMLTGTWLSATPEPWMVTEDVAYGVTHSVFYSTDYGRTLLFDRFDVLEYLRTWLPAWFTIFRTLDNFDLYAELLMVAAYTGLCEEYSEHVADLLSHQTHDGRFPGPPGSAAAIIDSTTPNARAEFLRDYHTTLVGVLALLGGLQLAYTEHSDGRSFSATGGQSLPR